MANTNVLRQAGQTVGLSVTASSNASTTIAAYTNDQVNYTSFLNTSTNPVAIKMSSVNPCPAAVFPTDSTPGDFVLPASMQTPIVLATPAAPYYMTAIALVSGPSLIYATPVNDQS